MEKILPEALEPLVVLFAINPRNPVNPMYIYFPATELIYSKKKSLSAHWVYGIILK